MNPDEYRKVKEIFQSVLEIATAERRAFLDENCNGDELLRAEVERLLASNESEFLEVPAVSEVADEIAAVTSKAGQMVGHYAVIRKIGSGGMGEVYLAEDRKLGRKVAIKILPDEYISDSDRLHRFQQEARTASSLNHPNIITIHDIGEHNGSHFIATEYVEGETLRHRLHRERLSAGEALDYGVQLAAAIAMAHEAGITHRDIKPENIMIRRDRILKVLDFGLAKAWNTDLFVSRTPLLNDEPTVKMFNTLPGVVMGTVQYMSPEQARGQTTDARSDIWSVGCVLYEMFAGDPAFKGDSSADLFAEIVKSRPTPVSQHNSEVPERLDEIISKSLEKEVDDRYQTSRDLLNDLKILKRKFDVGDVIEFSEPEITADSNAGAATRPNLINTKSGPKDLTTVRGREYLIWGIKAHRLMSFWIGLLVLSLLIGTAFLVRKYWRGPNEIRVEYAGKMRLASQTLESSSLDPTQQLLDEFKPQLGETDLRGFEWGYISRLVADRRLTKPMELPHSGGVEGVAFSRSGSTLATAGLDNSIQLWDVPTGEKLATLIGHKGWVWSVEFSMDGTKLLSASSDKTVRIWNIESGTIALTLGSEDNALENPVFSPDGKLVFASDVDSIRSWDVLNGKQTLRRIRTGERNVLFAISPDNKWIAYRYAGSSVSMVEVSSERSVTSLKGHSDVITDIEFSPDSKHLITGSADGSARLWAAGTGNNIKTFVGHKDGVYDVSFSPDGNSIATGSHDKTIKIWHAHKGYLLHTLRGHLDKVQALSFSFDGSKIASGGGSDDSSAKLWTVPLTEARGVLRGHNKAVKSVVFSRDSKRLLSTDAGGESRLWSVDDEREEQVLKIEGHPAFSPDGATLAGADGKKLRFWDLVTGRVRQTIDLPRSPGQITFSPNGETIVTNHLFEDNTLRLWESATGRAICSITPHSAGTWWFSFTDDGKRIITSSLGDNSIREWDTANCDKLSEFVGPATARYGALWAGNGRIIALEIMNSLRSLKMINVKNGSEIASIVGHDADLKDAKFSPDGDRLATCSKDGTIKLWDSVTGQELLSINPMAGEIETIDFSPDGKSMAAAAADGSVRLFKSNI